MNEQKYEDVFYQKYLVEFNDMSDVRDVIDEMFARTDGFKCSIAYKNLDEFFITKDLEYRLDYLKLLQGLIDDKTYEFIEKKFIKNYQSMQAPQQGIQMR